ncbi:hypothetical protein EV421DRAFT_1745771 [Armillaria borealis]|uniref:Uncharacterized protein n=1 Tax=Armillaria borealis TaxID=47425 RepID=A0AA39ICH7_9AGAR|nr:hypothetical protein EV421DRAFT_1745771 [Armillaria borealis]
MCAVDSCVIMFKEMSVDIGAEEDSVRNAEWTAWRIMIWHGKMPGDSGRGLKKDRNKSVTHLLLDQCLMFKVDSVEQDIMLHGGVFSHESVSMFDPGSGIRPMISNSSSHSHIMSCLISNICPPIKSSVLFVNNVKNKYYAATFAVELHIPYIKHPHMDTLASHSIRTQKVATAHKNCYMGYFLQMV